MNGHNCVVAEYFVHEIEQQADVGRKKKTPKKKKLATLFVARQVATSVIKRATSLFHTFCGNVAKHVARFCCPFYLTLRPTDVV